MPETDLFIDEPFIPEPGKSYYNELVGENAKYKTQEDLAISNFYKDEHIQRLEREQEQLRQELNTRIKYEEFIDRINSMPIEGQNNQPEPPRREASAMTPQEVERLVEQKLVSRQQEDRANQNVNQVISELQKAYGTNYAQQLTRQTADLGMSQEQMKDLAASNPKAVFRLLGIAGEGGHKPNLFEAPPRNQMSSMPITQGKGYSYYEDLRKKDVREYFSPKVQNEMFTRIREMGEEAFYNN